MTYHIGSRSDQAAYALRLGTNDVGQRVSLRRVLGAEGGRPVYGDVVGELESWTDGVLSVRRRDGLVVRIAEDTVVAGKVVPPLPDRRRVPGRRPAVPDAASSPDPGTGPEGLGERSQS